VVDGVSDQVANVVVGERVKDVFLFSSALDHALRMKDLELLRERREFGLRGLCELAHAELATIESMQEAEPGGIAGCAKQAGGALELLVGNDRPSAAARVGPASMAAAFPFNHSSNDEVLYPKTAPIVKAMHAPLWTLGAAHHADGTEDHHGFRMGTLRTKMPASRRRRPQAQRSGSSRASPSAAELIAAEETKGRMARALDGCYGERVKGAAAQRAPSFEELYQAVVALPPGLTGEILEPGVIRTMSRPGGPHRYGAWQIRRSLGGDDASEGGTWWIEQEAEVRLLGERLVVPDLSAWRLADGEASPPAFVHDNLIVRVPGWCCEILSPSTVTIDRDVKVPLYASAHVEWIWLVDPETRRVEVLRVTDQRALLHEVIEGDAKRVIPPFSSSVDTERWWLARPAGE
jgi:Uma2 family endonuclease